MSIDASGGVETADRHGGSIRNRWTGAWRGGNCIITSP